jgi:uncharacterized protein with WD repeat
MGAGRCVGVLGRASNGVTAEWSPDGRYLITATTAPRLRVDNGFEVFRYDGTLVHREPKVLLLDAKWRPSAPGQRRVSAGRQALCLNGLGVLRSTPHHHYLLVHMVQMPGRSHQGWFVRAPEYRLRIAPLCPTHGRDRSQHPQGVWAERE